MDCHATYVDKDAEGKRVEKEMFIHYLDEYIVANNNATHAFNSDPPYPEYFEFFKYQYDTDFYSPAVV